MRHLVNPGEGGGGVVGGLVGGGLSALSTCQSRGCQERLLLGEVKFSSDDVVFEKRADKDETDFLVPRV